MKSRLLLGTIIFCALSGLAQAGDREDVAAVLEQYRVLEEKGDMLAQGKLMTDDRVMIWAGGRQKGENRKGMKEQQDWMTKFEAEFPGVRYEVETRDMEIRTWGDAAMATYEWHPTRIVPKELPPEKVKKLPPAKIPMIMAHMLVKQQGQWKIAFTTFVPLKDEPQTASN